MQQNAPVYVDMKYLLSNSVLKIMNIMLVHSCKIVWQLLCIHTWSLIL